MSNFSLPRTAGRAGLATSAAALLALGLAAPATADEVETYEGSTVGQYTGNAEEGPQVHMTGASAPASLFNLEIKGSDGPALTAYCIDFRTNIVHNAWYKEDDWANYPGEGDFAQPGKVHWILQNSYPNVAPETVGDEAGVEGLASEDALSGTQAAIWHFSNDMDLDPEANGEDVVAVYDYLVGAAEDLPQEPDAALSVTPDEPAVGEAGEIVGEFQVESNASDIEFTLDAPEGVELVDVETGEAVESVNSGDTVGFGVPADADEGEASFKLEATAEIETGRLFQGKKPHEPTQTLITAEDGEATAKAEASASWTPGKDDEEPPPTDEPSEPEEPSDEPSEPSDKPSEPGDDKPAPPEEDEPTLPVTGGALAGLVAAGVAALGAGGGALYLSRKRKAAADDESDE
ncbi:thioester domain-containing protein [Nocardiopsis oceani]